MKPLVREDLTVVELDGTQTVQEMAAEIASAFGLPIPEITEQVRDVVTQLGDGGLLVGVPRAAPPEEVPA
jgi:hypothetical protein